MTDTSKQAAEPPADVIARARYVMSPRGIPERPRVIEDAWALIDDLIVAVDTLLESGRVATQSPRPPGET